MTLSTAQSHALEQGFALPLTINDTECVVIRRDVYEQLRGASYDDSAWSEDELESLAVEMFASLDGTQKIS